MYFEDQFDIVVVGGGLVGFMVGVGLFVCGLCIVVVDFIDFNCVMGVVGGVFDGCVVVFFFVSINFY